MNGNEHLHKLIHDEDYKKKHMEEVNQYIQNYNRRENSGKLELVHDPKKEIKFWIEMLSNPKLDDESISLINKCLQNELTIYLNPITNLS